MVLEALIYLPFSEAQVMCRDRLIKFLLKLDLHKQKSTCSSLVIRSILKASRLKYGLASLSTKTIGSMPEDQQSSRKPIELQLRCRTLATTSPVLCLRINSSSSYCNCIYTRIKHLHLQFVGYSESKFCGLTFDKNDWIDAGRSKEFSKTN